MKSISIVILFLLVGFVLFPKPVFADVVVEQIVETEVVNTKSVATYRWSISDKNFRLNISSKNGEILYIFNGRNFYACSKLNNSILEDSKNFQVVDQKLVDKMKKGVCQAVPLNFMTRFFLSPAGAISTIDYTDGMKISLKMQTHDLELQGKSKVMASACSMFKRSFAMQREISDKTSQHQSLNQQGCYTDDFTWRDAFWKQISRNLMRQKNTKALYKDLNKDMKKVSGFVLNSKDEFEKTDIKGKVLKGKRTIVTKLIKRQQKISKRDYQIPAGFSVIDIHNVQFMAESKESKKHEIDEDPVPQFLYYILGGVL